MTTQESSLGNDLLAGFKGTEQPGANPGAPAPKDTPGKPAEPDYRQQAFESEKARAVAEAELKWHREHSEKSKEEPKVDVLKEAIDALPDEEKAAALKIKPLLEKMMSSQKGEVMSKAEVEKLLTQHAEDSKNIAHLELWKKDMTKEWDGQNGKPRFSWDELHKYMTEKGYKDPQDAFYLLHRDSLIKYAASLGPKPAAPVDRGGRSAPPAGYEPPKDKNEAMSNQRKRATERLAQHGL